MLRAEKTTTHHWVNVHLRLNWSDGALELTPREVKALVGQEAQRELQTGEQEEVGEVDQAQQAKFLHSCADKFTSCQSAEVEHVKATPQNGVCTTYSLWWADLLHESPQKTGTRIKGSEGLRSPQTLKTSPRTQQQK